MTAAETTGDTAIPSWPMKRECPFHPPGQLAVLRRERPVTRVRIWDGSHPWLVTSYELCRQMLRDQRLSNISDLPGYPHSVPGMKALRATPSFATMDPPEHTRHRQMLTSDFSIDRIDKLRPFLEQLVAEHLDAMERQGGPMDLMAALAFPIPSLAVAALLGVPRVDHDYFNAAAMRILARSVTREESLEWSNDLKRYLDGLLTEKISEPTDDLLSRLGQKVAAGELSREEALSDALLVLVAGHETTANQIGLGVLSLLENPDQLEMVRSGAVDLPVAIQEILRYQTVAQAGRRRVALEDIEIGGETIRKGDGVIIDIMSPNRDESVFEDPDEFRVDRNPKKHVAFGFGVHQCIGQRLVRAEMEIVLARLFERFPDLRLAARVDDLEFKWDEMFYGVQELPVTW